MKPAGFVILLMFLFFSSEEKGRSPQQDFCKVKNTTTQAGEEIAYTVYYSVAELYVYAGYAVFSNKLEMLDGKPVYHITGAGRSNKKYDWIYQVRDRYESYIDTATMQPLIFKRDVHEGKVKKKEQIKFDHSSHTATTDSGTFKIPSCVQDVLSTVYFARNIDFSPFKENDRIPYKMFLENEVHSLFIRYLGKEVVNTTFGKFKAIKFSAQLVPGTIFSGEEDMVVWVTDDANRVPVRIQSSILIGSIKVDMSGYKNLRHPLTSLMKKKSK